MSITFFHRAFRMVLLLAVQLLVMNHIHLFGYGTPLLLAGLTLKFHRGTSRISLLLWGFVMGMFYDMFSNTTGMGMATCTLLSMMQPFLLNLFTPREASAELRPSFLTIGQINYILYVLLTMLIFHAVFYALDAFTISNWILTLTGISTGTLIATMLMVLFDLISHPKRHES